MTLAGKQFRDFSQALRKAFTPADLERMLRFRLNKDLNDFTALTVDYQQIAFNLIGTAERGGWTMKLLAAAREEQPDNPELLAFAQGFNLAPAQTPTKAELERIIVEANSFFDIARWRARLGQVEVQVCSVEIRNEPYGTGFLLGPDVVMTNYHVVEDVIRGSQGLKPGDIALRFDFKRLAGGDTINSGTVYHLAPGGDDWLIDVSPYSAADVQEEFGKAEPAADELDYALLRVDGTPGEDPVGGDKGDPQARPRGWIPVSTAGHDFLASPALYIVQHPLGQPLKLALDTQAVLAVNPGGTRVRYRTNTDHGSSGSPCFDKDWNLVALHHSGSTRVTPTWNEGIPFPKILDLIASRGKREAIPDEEDTQP